MGLPSLRPKYNEDLSRNKFGSGERFIGVKFKRNNHLLPLDYYLQRLFKEKRRALGASECMSVMVIINCCFFRWNKA